MEQQARWRWYHGVGFYVAVQGLAFGLGKLAERTQRGTKAELGETVLGNESYNAFYNAKQQPIFAPPDWSFAPVWTLNNALCIWGLLRVLNMPKETQGRDAFLALQATTWASYTAFNGLYFGLRSPINGAIDTNIGLAATLASFYVALFHLRDSRVVLSQATIVPWLLLAAPTATAVAAWNNDEFYGTGPLAEPPQGWVKQPAATTSAQQHP